MKPFQATTRLPQPLTLSRLLLSLLPLIAAAPPPAAPSTPDPSLELFEERFVNSLPYDPAAANDTTLRLVGFKRVAIPPDEVTSFEAAWQNPPSEWLRRDEAAVAGRHKEHFWYDRARRELRVYFPVEGALLRRHGDSGGDDPNGRRGEFAEADALGQVEGVTDHVKRDIDSAGRDRAVVGRRVTEQVSGVEGNVIRDGIIYLSTPALPVRHLNSRTAVYDFGYKSLNHHHEGDSHEKREDDGKKGCLQNHNGINCSKAYNINQGRCPMNPKTCMDYNGFVTDCKKGTTYKFGIPTLGKVVKLVGSDCSVSLARGHCWNEVM